MVNFIIRIKGQAVVIYIKRSAVLLAENDIPRYSIGIGFTYEAPLRASPNETPTPRTLRSEFFIRCLFIRNTSLTATSVDCDFSNQPPSTGFSLTDREGIFDTSLSFTTEIRLTSRIA